MLTVTNARSYDQNVRFRMYLGCESGLYRIFSDMPFRNAVSVTLTLCAAGLLWLVHGPPLPAQQVPRNRSAPSPATPRQIETAVRRATSVLQKRAGDLSGGQASLAAMALLKSGVAGDGAEILAVVSKIDACIKSGRYAPTSSQQHIYEAGVGLMALANADPRKYRPQMQAITNYIIEQQGPNGDWDYPARTTGDTSISQYAILGLWEAARAGITVPPKVWDLAAAWHVARQLPDGSFMYHPPLPPTGPGTHTMTVAGIGSLHVIRLHLYPGARDTFGTKKRQRSGLRYGVLEPVEESEDGKPARPRVTSYRPTVRLSAIDKAISRGLDWLSERFTVDPETPFKLYYLYGLERTTALANLTEIDDHNWYVEGAAKLVATQAPDGTWSDSSGAEPATSFGLLFLVRATAKMLHRRAPAARRFGAGVLAGGRGLPDDLNSVVLKQGQVEVRKLQGPLDELLSELENAQSRKIESAQAAVVDLLQTGDPEALIGQRVRLEQLAKDKRPEVRRTAFWALGRTGDLRSVPTLIAGLRDTDTGCLIEARNALEFLTKKLHFIELPDEPSPAQRAQAISRWQKWYLGVRPYAERDDLQE